MKRDKFYWILYFSFGFFFFCSVSYLISLAPLPFDRSPQPWEHVFFSFAIYSLVFYQISLLRYSSFICHCSFFRQVSLALCPVTILFSIYLICAVVELVLSICRYAVNILQTCSWALEIMFIFLCFTFDAPLFFFSSQFGSSKHEKESRKQLCFEVASRQDWTNHVDIIYAYKSKQNYRRSVQALLNLL